MLVTLAIWREIIMKISLSRQQGPARISFKTFNIMKNCFAVIFYLEKYSNIIFNLFIYAKVK